LELCFGKEDKLCFDELILKGAATETALTKMSVDTNCKVLKEHDLNGIRK